MDPRSVIANRIDLQLRRHLGQGVDAKRALTDVRYARDVLLVCDAMAGTTLPLLARQFRNADESLTRAASPLEPGHDAGPPQPWGANTSGFGLTQMPPLGGEEKVRENAKRRWFSPRRWLRG